MDTLQLPTEHAGFRRRTPDRRIAKLLGLSIKEYLHLSHSGLREITNSSNKVIQYYLEVSPNNQPEVLRKLKLNKNNIIYFDPEKVETREEY
jgi:hypothetical protein